MTFVFGDNDIGVGHMEGKNTDNNIEVQGLSLFALETPGDKSGDDIPDDVYRHELIRIIFPDRESIKVLMDTLKKIENDFKGE